MRNIILIWLLAASTVFAAGNTEQEPYTANTILPDSIVVALYHCDENSGVTLADSSVFGNTGTLADVTWLETGLYNSALYFSGDSDRVYILDAASLDNYWLTVQCWIYPITFSGTQTIIEKDSVWQVEIDAGGQVLVTLDSSGVDHVWSSACSLDAGRWTNLSITYDGVALLLWLNGEVSCDTMIAMDSLNTNNRPVLIGNNIDFTQDFSGYLDEIRICKYAIDCAFYGDRKLYSWSNVYDMPNYMYDNVVSWTEIVGKPASWIDEDVDWADLVGVPAGFSDNDDQGIDCIDTVGGIGAGLGDTLHLAEGSGITITRTDSTITISAAAGTGADYADSMRASGTTVDFDSLFINSTKWKAKDSDMLDGVHGSGFMESDGDTVTGGTYHYWIGGNFYANGNMYTNYDGAASGIAYVYFNATNEYFRYDGTTSQKFELTDDLAISGTFLATDDIYSQGDAVFINSDAATNTENSLVGFAGAGSEYLAWDGATDQRFEFSDDIYAGGTITSSGHVYVGTSTADHYVYFETGATDEYLQWDNTNGQFNLSDDLNAAPYYFTVYKLDTGQGYCELYPMDQGVQTTDTVKFSDVIFTPKTTAVSTEGRVYYDSDNDNLYVYTTAGWVDLTQQDTDTKLTEEEVEDYAGGMVTGNTESGIAVTYQDGDGTIDYEVSGITSAMITDGTIDANDILDGECLDEIDDDDGAGSGLDADYLDGISSSGFMEADGDTVTGGTYHYWIGGNFMQNGYQMYIDKDSSSTVPVLYFRGTEGYLQWTSSLSRFDFSDVDLYVPGNYQIWHAGNDGSSSGLDADLLDGVSSSGFMEADGDTVTGGTYHYWIGGNFMQNGYQMYIDKDSSSTVPVLYFRGTEGYLQWTSSLSRFDFSDVDLYVPGNYKIWHAGNDGTGSGLDADLLDGSESSAFLTATKDTATDLVVASDFILDAATDETLRWSSTYGAFDFTDDMHWAGSVKQDGASISIDDDGNAAAGIIYFTDSAASIAYFPISTAFLFDKDFCPNPTDTYDLGSRSYQVDSSFTEYPVVFSRIVPDANAGAVIGSSALEWDSLYVQDASVSSDLKLGSELIFDLATDESLRWSSTYGAFDFTDDMHWAGSAKQDGASISIDDDGNAAAAIVYFTDSAASISYFPIITSFLFDKDFCPNPTGTYDIGSATYQVDSLFVQDILSPFWTSYSFTIQAFDTCNDGSSYLAYGKHKQTVPYISFTSQTEADTILTSFVLPAELSTADSFGLEVYWFGAAASTNAVAWFAQIYGASDDDSVATSLWGPTEVDDAGKAAAYDLNVADFGRFAISGAAAGDQVFIRITRDGNDAGDTYASAALFTGAKLEYKADR